MHVAEVLSSERAVPAVATVAVHVLFAYVVATSAGIIPKLDGIKQSTYVAVDPRTPEPIEETSLVSNSEPVITQRYEFPKVIPEIAVADETLPQQPTKEITTGGIQREGGEGVSIPHISGARILSKTEPAYPNISRLREEEGIVLLRITITAFGAIGSVSVEKTSGFARLDEAAMKAVREWRFAPAMRGSEAIATTTTVPVRFELR
jgi:protein TonB